MKSYCGFFCVALIVSAVGCKGGGPINPAPPASPQPPVSPPPAPSPPQITRYQLSGIVTDDNGTPVAGASLALEDVRGYDHATASTNAAGYYETSFETYMTGFLLHAGGGKYERHYVPVLLSDTADIVKNLRLRRIRTIEAGQSIGISIDADSSLAYDGDDWVSLDRVWEKLHVRVADAGTLTVTARPEIGGVEPSLAVSCVSVADNCHYNWVKAPQGSGNGSLMVKANSLFEIRLVIASGTAPQRYEVTTSLQR